jgi:hypothetical protein
MWLKHRTNGLSVEPAPAQPSESIYLEAYNYALDLCENPEIAREVAASFVKCLETEKQILTESEFAKT